MHHSPAYPILQKEVASARTFVFVKEIRSLLKKNLIKGGDLDNAIVIYDTPVSQEEYDQLADIMGIKNKNAKQIGYIMNKPLLYTNEPARHKLLDIIGDLALVGGFIKGKIIADRPGHKINNEFARAIRNYYLTEVCKGKRRKHIGDMQFNTGLSINSPFYWNHP